MNDSPIRLLVSDIDGTMVRRDKSLPEENIAAVREVLARGVPVSLISARPAAGILPIARALGLSGPYGAFNGGTVIDGRGAILADSTLADETARRLVDLYAAHGITIWLFTADRWLSTNFADPHNGREIQSSGLQPEPLDVGGPLPDGVHKVVAVCDDPAWMDAIEKAAREAIGDAANIVRSQDYYLDATALQADKGHGIEALAARFGVPLSQVAVLGDQANDIPMFRRAGLSVAMGQASEAVQSQATRTAMRAADAGVADAIRCFVLPRIPF